MALHDPILRAFGGSALKGDNFVRWAYVDEAGTSVHEKVCTVGGVLIHADKHHRALKARLNEIRGSLPEPLRQGLIFHAKDIWHGNKQFDKDLWDSHGIQRDERRALIERICDIPEEFDLPVLACWVQKDLHLTTWKRILAERPIPNMTPNRATYALAFGMCAVSAEAYMRERCDADEVAQIVAEDTNEMREHADWAYSLMETATQWSETMLSYLPLERLTEAPQFALKRRSAILQIADSIAFVVNRHITKGAESDVGHLWEKLRDRMTLPSALWELEH